MTEHSKDGNQQTTKLERIGKRAASQPETVFNNVGYVMDKEMLRNCYQRQDGRKAVGIDRVTKEGYGNSLEENLEDLLGRIRRGAYKPQASKIVEISKEDGSTRPLAISCFEDKIVQMAVGRILTKIFEPIFLPCSYGYREGKNGHEALRALMKYSNQCSQGATIEIDLRKYFNSIPHEILRRILRRKISDTRFLKLVETLIRAPEIGAEGKARINQRGCPQGLIISPILANIYLHNVIDDWFYKIRQTHIKGKAELVRFADDMVFVFEKEDEAKRFYEVLPKRLEKFGLELQQGKSSLIATGRRVAEEAERQGKRPLTYKFLGFVCYWGQSRTGHWRLKYKSRADRMTAKLNGLRRYLKGNLNEETYFMLKRVSSMVKGWINYHAITDNQRQVSAFILQTKRELLRWINRKGGKRRMNWVKFSKLLKRLKYPESFKTQSMFIAY